MIYDTPPAPPDPTDSLRWDHTRLRRRMLDGLWWQDLEQRMIRHFGPQRRAAQGPRDLSSNPFRVIAREMAALYPAPPRIRHAVQYPATPGGEAPSPDPLDGLTGDRGAITRSGLWAQMPRVQAWTIGCREYLLRAHATATGELRYRPVPPDHVIAEASGDTPDIPALIREARLRMIPGLRDPVWCWDVLDVRDPSAPIYRIETMDDRHTDHTERVLGAEVSGPAYPYRRTDGTPVLPYVLYHAERMGDRLWDPYEGIETVEGSLDLAVGWSFWFHVLRDASWPQRWMANATVAGLDVGDAGSGIGAARPEIETDPANVLALTAIESGNQIMVGQWQPGGDPEALARSLMQFAVRLAQDAGLPSSDLQKVSADPRSGQAIALSNEGKRAAQRRYAPHLRSSDEALVALSAVLLNRATGSAYPEDDYSVIYSEIPLSADELASRREHAIALLAAGMISPERAYADLTPGLTEAQARQDLDAIRRRREELAATTPDQSQTAQFNELTLAIERLIAAGDYGLANAVRRQIVTLLGVEYPGDLTPPEKEPTP